MQNRIFRGGEKKMLSFFSWRMFQIVFASSFATSDCLLISTSSPQPSHLWRAFLRMNTFCPLTVPYSSHRTQTTRHARAAGTRNTYVILVVARPLTGRSTVVKDGAFDSARDSLQAGKQ